MDIDLNEIAIYIVLIIVVLLIAQHLNVVVSGSMEPVMYRGDIVVLEQANLLGFHEFDTKDIEIGDIVVYVTPHHDGPIIHRVIDKGQVNDTMVFKIKGDNNDVADPGLVSENQIISRAITFNGQPILIPKIGYISILL